MSFIEYPYPESEHVPAESLTRLSEGHPVVIIDALEFFEKWEASEALGEQIQRIELLGVDDSSRQSFHCIDTLDGRLAVVFIAKRFQDLGRIFQVIVNRETTDFDFNKYLDIDEYFVAQDFENITRTSTSLNRSQHTKSWQMNTTTGPILYNFNDKVEAKAGRDYAIWLPEENPDKPLLERMDERSWMVELHEILRGLTEGTVEPDKPLTETRDK